MKVSRDFEQIYRTEKDPWSIGSADSDRYNFYYKEISARLNVRKELAVDVGAGFGAFLARFGPSFKKLIGLDVSGEAVTKARERHPSIEFIQADAARLTDLKPRLSGQCDLVICSDVLYYLDDKAKTSCLDAVADFLRPDGTAAVAAWCPGGNYLQPDEFIQLTASRLTIDFCRALDSGHVLIVGRKKRRLIAITIDYETWQPIPAGKKIDWDKDVFAPAKTFLDIADRQRVALTLFAEMGEYFWLRQYNPSVAVRMEDQWRDAVRRGHDVQLHLHPAWLPELGAREVDGVMRWDNRATKLSDFQGSIESLIGRAKTALEDLLRRERPDYRVTTFRAGAYQAQPFKRIGEALIANGLIADSSVYAGGVSAERGYDYSLAATDHQPYFANPYDPQLRAAPSESKLIEIPIFTFESGQRWFLDQNEGALFADRLFQYMRRCGLSSLTALRALKAVRNIFRAAVGRLPEQTVRPLVYRLLPRAMAFSLADYRPEPPAGHETFVMIGHTKGDHDFQAIEKNIERIKRDGRFDFVTITDMAMNASADLSRTLRAGASEEAAFQVKREYAAIMGESRNEAQSIHLQRMIPLDRQRILDLGCGAGYWTKRIAEFLPWSRVTGVDAGADFIAKAQRAAGGERVDFVVGDFGALPFKAGAFDAVYADNVLEHAFDIDRTLSEIHRVLGERGVLVAAVPSDARNPRRPCDNHMWKTAPHEVKMRLANAGFQSVRINEVDTRTGLGMPPYPPSLDKMMYITAWKGVAAPSLERALDAMTWVHNRLDPSRSQESNDPLKILQNGVAYCWGYVVALGEILKSEGYDVRWVTMLARDHPKGRGPEKIDSHEVIEAVIEGKTYVLDPMANTIHPHSVAELLRNPALANKKSNPDERYRARRYDLYDTDFWYSRVYELGVRKDYRDRLRLQKINYGSLALEDR